MRRNIASFVIAAVLAALAGACDDGCCKCCDQVNEQPCGDDCIPKHDSCEQSYGCACYCD
ncbi:MAG: hypothetical protein JRI55_18435 [Deltaproteobacteria bacterium]|jgi:hypothetical protein|nr:hypothetical protein [Deltaproteobacteria bacterium]